MAEERREGASALPHSLCSLGRRRRWSFNIGLAACTRGNSHPTSKRRSIRYRGSESADGVYLKFLCSSTTDTSCVGSFIQIQARKYRGAGRRCWRYEPCAFRRYFLRLCRLCCHGGHCADVWRICVEGGAVNVVAGYSLQPYFPHVLVLIYELIVTLWQYELRANIVWMLSFHVLYFSMTAFFTLYFRRYA